MNLLSKLFGKKDGDGDGPKRLDYLNEGLALERQGEFEAALTSYRLAHRDHPGDPRILLNLAICLTKTGQADEAIRHYRKALEADPQQSGAHYGLAFLLLKRGERAPAAEHLRAFLVRPPQGPDAARWVRHATDTLAALSSGEAADSA